MTPASVSATSPPWWGSRNAAPTASSPSWRAAGYVVKERDGRRNRYHVQAHLPLREVIGRQRTIGEMLDLLVDAHGGTDGDGTTGLSPNYLERLTAGVWRPAMTRCNSAGASEWSMMARATSLNCVRLLRA